jgi:hypothetical protein
VKTTIGSASYDNKTAWKTRARMVLKRVIITMKWRQVDAPEDGVHRKHRNASGKVNPKGEYKLELVQSQLVYC